MTIYNKSLPKIPYDKVMENIAEEHYFTLDKVITDTKCTRVDLTMICVLISKNGFLNFGVSGTNSKENFDEAIAKKVSKDKAINELWGMLAYQDRTLAMIAEKRNIGFEYRVTDEATWKTS